MPCPSSVTVTRAPPSACASSFTPFLLRRLKSDPAIIQDLPPKNEMKVICTLTREQATLYQAVVDEEMRRIESAEGIGRRGRVLALLLFLKQICNHPAHYLGETGPLPNRSGKLTRVTEMLDEALAAGDKALVFTQFREMGDRLSRTWHPCSASRSRSCTVARRGRRATRWCAASRKSPTARASSSCRSRPAAPGSNLTAASHVFHFDRWWNPAVEDQATDRAYRIGQTRAVQVHKLVCAGTVEEKVDRLLEQKRDLATKVMSTGESWITELGDDELRELFSLAPDVAVASDDEDREGGPADAAPRRRRARARTAEVQA